MGSKHFPKDCTFYETLIFPAEDSWIELADREANHGQDDHLYVTYN